MMAPPTQTNIVFKTQMTLYTIDKSVWCKVFPTKRLGPTKGKWIKELLEVLWAYRCMPQSTTQETPFNLTYRTEAMIPVEVGKPSLQRQTLDLTLKNESLLVSLGLINELRDRNRIREEACK